MEQRCCCWWLGQSGLFILHQNFVRFLYRSYPNNCCGTYSKYSSFCRGRSGVITSYYSWPGIDLNWNITSWVLQQFSGFVLLRTFTKFRSFETKKLQNSIEYQNVTMTQVHVFGFYTSSINNKFKILINIDLNHHQTLSPGNRPTSKSCSCNFVFYFVY